ncbi:hypothetical protein [Actinomadura sp. NPDC049753]
MASATPSGVNALVSVSSAPDLRARDGVAGPGAGLVGVAAKGKK